MLTYLGVKGFAIIDELKIEFREGFNVITGETGAGKSIIVNALSALMNGKVTAESVRSGFLQAEVTGCFDDGDDEYILKRVVTSTGRSRAFLNDEPITLSRLETLGNALINMYGQNEFQRLLDKENYTDLIDDLLALNEERDLLAERYDAFKRVSADLTQKRQEVQGRERELELLEFQIDEIERINLIEGEEETIKERLKVLKSAERIRGVLSEIDNVFRGGEDSIQARFKKLINSLRPFGDIENLADLKTRLENFSFDSEDMLLEARNIEKTLFVDAEEMEKIEERLSEIFRLKDKYGKTYNEITQYASSAKDRLHYIRSLSTDIGDLEQSKILLENEVGRIAGKLSMMRRKGSKAIEKAIVDELEFLCMKGIQFSIAIIEKETIERDGRDDVEFMISTNPGEPLKPLRRIASGGELSRIMLAIKRVVGGNDRKTLIFDEVDAGIGGKVADMVGKRLKELAQKHQVLCITHLPQIASYGDHHFLVEKVYQEQKTVTGIKELPAEERIQEIARMMGGTTITRKTMERAEEMLKND